MNGSYITLFILIGFFFAKYLSSSFCTVSRSTKDSDVCLNSSPDWESSGFTCATAKSYCKGNWVKDTWRCCPETCRDGVPLDESTCDGLPGSGSCFYPFEVEKERCTRREDEYKSMSVHSFGKNKVALDEGNRLGVKYDISYDQCEVFCKRTQDCKSFSYCTSPDGSTGNCRLRDKLLFGNEPRRDDTFGDHCTTYYFKENFDVWIGVIVLIISICVLIVMLVCVVRNFKIKKHLKEHLEDFCHCIPIRDKSLQSDDIDFEAQFPIDEAFLETHTNVAYFGDKINNNESGYRIGASLIENGIGFERKESCSEIGGYSDLDQTTATNPPIEYEQTTMMDETIPSEAPTKSEAPQRKTEATITEVRIASERHTVTEAPNTTEKSTKTETHTKTEAATSNEDRKTTDVPTTTDSKANRKKNNKAILIFNHYKNQNAKTGNWGYLPGVDEDQKIMNQILKDDCEIVNRVDVIDIIQLLLQLKVKWQGETIDHLHFHYSGHGIYNQTISAHTPNVDARNTIESDTPIGECLVGNNGNDGLVSILDVQKMLSEFQAQKITIILDCCRSLDRPKGPTLQIKLAPLPKVDNENWRKIFTIYASCLTQPAYDARFCKELNQVLKATDTGRIPVNKIARLVNESWDRKGCNKQYCIDSKVEVGSNWDDIYFPF